MKFFEKNNEQQHVEIRCEDIIVILDKIKDSIVKMKVELIEPEKRYDYSQIDLIISREIPAAIGKVPKFFSIGNIILLENTNYLTSHILRTLRYHSTTEKCIIAKRFDFKEDNKTYVVEHSYSLKIKNNDIFDDEGNLVPVQEPVITTN